MAAGTDPKLQNQVIYSVFVRNHTPEGTFRALIPDLPRIRALGVDIIWLLPVHPIGHQARKGTLGSPYANMDYRAVNPELGTEEDLRALVDAIHDLGMRCFLDVVYNHTSPDSVLWREHPEFFYRKPDGSPGNHVGDWTDIIDLDYTVPELWDYQIETLKYWAGLADGFRCDAASLVPVAFWERARKEVEQVHPGFVWLAETLHFSFGHMCRNAGLTSEKDLDMYRAFDLEYDHDVREVFDGYIKGKYALSHWLDLVNYQDFAYPANYNKMRFLENHDSPRIAGLVTEEAALTNLTAMLYFLKGTTLLYAGQEKAVTHRPGLFDRDTVCWDTGKDLMPLLQRLDQIKKEVLSAEDSFFAKGDDELDIAVCRRSDGVKEKAGIFSLKGKCGSVRIDAPDGTYENLMDGSLVEVKDGALNCAGRPIIFGWPYAGAEQIADF